VTDENFISFCFFLQKKKKKRRRKRESKEKEEKETLQVDINKNKLFLCLKLIHLPHLSCLAKKNKQSI
jgi:ligand-binding sensor protein